MGSNPKTQKKKPKKLKTLVLPKKSITESFCRDEIIWKLYKRCSKIGKGDQVRVHLQVADFPIDIKYKEKFFKKLKKEKIIKDYEIKTERKKLSPKIIEETTEPDLELFPLVLPEQLKNVPKNYSTIDCFEIDHVAVIKKCDPQKVKQYLKEDYKRIKKRIKVENIFKKEKIEMCGELRFGLNSGYVIYGETLTRFLFDGNEYRLLRALIDNKNQILNCKEVNQVLNPTMQKSNIKNIQDIGLIIRNIKRKLNIIGKNQVNDNLFDCKKGFMIDCDTGT